MVDYGMSCGPEGAGTVAGAVVSAGGGTPADTTGRVWDLTIPGNNDHGFCVVMASHASGSSILAHSDLQSSRLPGDAGPVRTRVRRP
jgi:hypothetical protein